MRFLFSLSAAGLRVSTVEKIREVGGVDTIEAQGPLDLAVQRQRYRKEMSYVYRAELVVGDGCIEADPLNSVRHLRLHGPA